MPSDDEFSTEDATEDTSAEDTGTEDTGSDDTWTDTTEDTSTDDTTTDDTGSEDTGSEDTGSEDTGSDDTWTDDTTEDTSSDDTTTEDTWTDDATEDTSSDDTTTEDTWTDDTTEDTSSDDTTTDDTSSDDTWTDDTTSSDDSTSDDAGGAAVGSELEPPFLVADQYPLDSGPHPPWTTLVDAPGFVGAILKAWEGLQYNDGGWFTNNWPAVRDAGGDRYGDSWFRGAYLFLKFAADGAAQADAYLRVVDKAGGWDQGDIIPVVDVELGSETNSNFKASPQQIVDCTSACADRIRSETGRRVMLYGRGAMRERSITDHMKCDVVWNPSYTAHMVTNGLQSWDLEDIVLWQYCGDNKGFVADLPTSVPGFAKLDISVYIKGSQRPTLQMVRDSLL